MVYILETCALCVSQMIGILTATDLGVEEDWKEETLKRKMGIVHLMLVARIHIAAAKVRSYARSGAPPLQFQNLHDTATIPSSTYARKMGVTN